MKNELTEQQRFEAGASRYADYLETNEGRLRLDLAWMNLREALKAAGLTRGRALDVGGGTGALALKLAAAGWEVMVVDSSASMLEIAKESARCEGRETTSRIKFYQADGASISDFFDHAAFDLITCHNVIEYVADPQALVSSIAKIVQPDGLVSLLARNRAGEALRDAVKLQDLDSARNALTAESVRESLYGGPARVFDAQSLGSLLEASGLYVVDVRGVRVVADYLPASFFSQPDAYSRLLDFEHEVGARPEFAAVARYTQVLARAS